MKATRYVAAFFRICPDHAPRFSACFRIPLTITQTKETNKRTAPQVEQSDEPDRLTSSGYLRQQSSENYSTPKSFMDKKM